MNTCSRRHRAKNCNKPHPTTLHGTQLCLFLFGNSTLKARDTFIYLDTEITNVMNDATILLKSLIVEIPLTHPESLHRKHRKANACTKKCLVPNKLPALGTAQPATLSRSNTSNTLQIFFIRFRAGPLQPKHTSIYPSHMPSFNLVMGRIFSDIQRWSPKPTRAGCGCQR